jgi:hypothetical protein
MNKVTDGTDHSDSSSAVSDKELDRAVVREKAPDDDESHQEAAQTIAKGKVKRRAKRRQPAEDDDGSVTFPQQVSHVWSMCTITLYQSYS